jgi:hypothetical protein
LQDLRCSGADAPIVTPERSSPNVQALTEATENATTSKLTPLPRSGFVLCLIVAGRQPSLPAENPFDRIVQRITHEVCGRPDGPLQWACKRYGEVV